MPRRTSSSNCSHPGRCFREYAEMSLSTYSVPMRQPRSAAFFSNNSRCRSIARLSPSRSCEIRRYIAACCGSVWFFATPAMLQYPRFVASRGMACSAPRASRFGSATRSIGQKYRPPDVWLQRLTANRRKRPDTFDPTPAGAGSIPQLGHVTSNFPRAIHRARSHRRHKSVCDISRNGLVTLA